MCNTTAMLTDIESKSGGLDPAEQEFSGRLLEILNGSTTALMISIGHRTGLFEAIKKQPATSQELADRAGLNERYVREWLGAMSTGGIVSLDRDSRRYSLPPAHAALLGRDATAGNMASMFQFSAVLGAVESPIVDCFRTGGGIPYEAFDRFHEVMAEESAQTVVAALEDAIIPLVPGLEAKLEQGIEVADIGCGSGRAMNHLAALYPASHFTGYDLCPDAIAVAQRQARELGLSNVTFVAIDAATLDAGEKFDLIFTFDAIHDQARPEAVLANIWRLLKPDGVYLMQDIDGHSDVADNMARPLSPFIYAISCMHCMTVSLSQGGAGLGAAWGEELALAMLRDAGFTQVKTHRLEHDIMNLYYVCRRT